MDDIYEKTKKRYLLYDIVIYNSYSFAIINLYDNLNFRTMPREGHI